MGGEQNPKFFRITHQAIRLLALCRVLATVIYVPGHVQVGLSTWQPRLNTAGRGKGVFRPAFRQPGETQLPGPQVQMGACRELRPS